MKFRSTKRSGRNQRKRFRRGRGKKKQNERILFE